MFWVVGDPSQSTQINTNKYKQNDNPKTFRLLLQLVQGLVTKIFRGLATGPNVLKKFIFEKNQILLIYSAGLWD